MYIRFYLGTVRYYDIRIVSRLLLTFQWVNEYGRINHLWVINPLKSQLINRKIIIE